MKCQKVRECFDDYLNAVLDEPALSDIKAHLENCPDCADELRFLEMVHQKTAALTEVKAPADLLANIHARIDASAKKSFFRKIILSAPQFAGVAVAVVLAIILIKLNSQPALKGSAQNLLTKTNEAETLKNAASSNDVKPAAPAIGIDQKRTSANNEKPSGGVSTFLQAPTEAKVAAVETLRVKVIPITDNKLALADKTDEETPNNAPNSFSKGLDVKKEKTGRATQEMDSPDPVKTILDKYQGHIMKIGNSPGKEEWIFEIPPEKYQSFLAELALIGQVEEKTGDLDGDEKTGEIDLYLNHAE